ncbi:hypothetical protein Y032_0246g8 [Ancylostoma ceylanicum]|uniref:Peptidase S9 prolyl oligopeptidase catalytic domain-containing protein n=1 Tax=Ancylostoma ceylanicum TaxID=53326 RepID=A0A016SDR2_9BILA|nr:hypothetical protein Y032_0246g8 [Ancylostoma ceylanicum]
MVTEATPYARYYKQLQFDSSNQPADGATISTTKTSGRDGRVVQGVILGAPCFSVVQSSNPAIASRFRATGRRDSYAGPGPQMASDQFREGYTESLVTSRNFAVVSIDGRGSNGRGWNYRSAIYGALGTVEIDDQIQAIRQMMKKYPFLDDRRLFVFGWSYGGFAAALMAERAPEAFFKCAISVAPVANFLFYDATYTERYMGNADRAAYDAGDIATNVSNFKKTRLLLIHGMYDDNVHFQHSALFIEALQRNNIGFDLMVFSTEQRDRVTSLVEEIEPCNFLACGRVGSIPLLHKSHIEDVLEE